MHCPTCRRRHDGQSSTCPRCQTDLAELLAVEEAAQALLAQADLHLRGGDHAAAEATLRQAAPLLGDSPELIRRQALSQLLSRRFDAAFVSWLRQPDS